MYWIPTKLITMTPQGRMWNNSIEGNRSFYWNFFSLKNKKMGDFPGGPAVKALLSSAGDAGSIPGRGAKIPHVSGPKHQNIEAIL